MGFSDLLTSSRGPGVIGTLLALLVLVGFGSLYMLVSVDGPPKKTITAEIRDLEMEIDSDKIQIQNAKQNLADAEVLKAKIKEGADLTNRNDVLAKQVEELTASKTTAEEAVTQATADWEKYKDDYRASEWASAIKEKLPDIKTPSGEMFTGVEIKSVSHTGVRISHSGGTREIKPEDLPQDLYDRFQFDIAKKEKILNDEKEANKIHITNVEYTNLDESRAQKAARIEALKLENQNLRAEVDASKKAIDTNAGAIQNMRMAIANEKNKKISNAPQMMVKLRGMEDKARANKDSIPVNSQKITKNEREISDIQDDLREIRTKMEKIVKDMAANADGPAEAPQK